MAKRRRKYTTEFKLEAVKLLLNRGDRTIADVAQGLGVAENLLHSWKKKYGTDAAAADTNGRGETSDEELKRLRREVAQLRRDREVLLKSITVFAKDRT